MARYYWQRTYQERRNECPKEEMNLLFQKDFQQTLLSPESVDLMKDDLIWPIAVDL